MPNLVNTLVHKEYDSEFSGARGILLVSFAGLTVEESSKLRNELAEHGVKLRMVRNSLARLVLQQRGAVLPEEAFGGNTAIAYGSAEQAILAAKVFSGPAVKKAGKVKLKAGVLEGRPLDARDAAALADVPDKRTLQAQILGCISGPARSLVGVINALPAGVARVIDAHASKGAGGAEAS